MSEQAVPEFFPVAKRKLDSLLADGWSINGYAIMKGEDRRGFVDFGGFVGWWLPEYYVGHTSEAQPGLIAAGKALVDRDCEYHGSNIVIPCESHADAIRLLREFRDALRAFEALTPITHSLPTSQDRGE